jgi:hypothetical protein
MIRTRSGRATAGPQDDNQELLIKTATVVDGMNTRLFGANGDGGSIHFILEQHRELSGKLETNKQELLTKIESVRTDLSKKMDMQNTDLEGTVRDLRKDHTDLDKKMTGWSYVISVVSFLGMAAMTALGLKIKTAAH